MSTLFRRSARLFSLILISAITVVIMSGCATLPWTKANSGPSGPATVAGRVISDRGAIIANASVILKGPSVRRTTTTDVAGRFLFQGVPLGGFTVSASCPGYKSSKQAVQVEKEGGAQVELRLKM